ncbi:MAG: PIN domain-containing protein [Pseudomonadota bacterium]
MDKKIIDTNLIIRYLVNDQPAHYKIARDFFDQVRLGKIKAILEQAVFTETVFVLSKVYEVPKEKIIEALTGLLEYKGVYNHEKEVLLEALSIYAQANLHIVDCIIIAKAQLQTIEIQSFDQELLKYDLKIRL